VLKVLLKIGGHSTSWNIPLLLVLIKQMLVLSLLKQVVHLVGPKKLKHFKLATLLQDSIWTNHHSLLLELGMDQITKELINMLAIVPLLVNTEHN